MRTLPATRASQLERRSEPEDTRKNLGVFRQLLMNATNVTTDGNSKPLHSANNQPGARQLTCVFRENRYGFEPNLALVYFLVRICLSSREIRDSTTRWETFNARNRIEPSQMPT